MTRMRNEASSLLSIIYITLTHHELDRTPAPVRHATAGEWKRRPKPLPAQGSLTCATTVTTMPSPPAAWWLSRLAAPSLSRTALSHCY